MATAVRMVSAIVLRRLVASRWLYRPGKLLAVSTRWPTQPRKPDPTVFDVALMTVPPAAGREARSA